MRLVELKNKESVCDSSELARNLNVKHAKVVQAIDRLLTDFPDLRVPSSHSKPIEKHWIEEREYRGQKYTAYLMNREFFSLLMGRFTTKAARQAQRRFNAAFYEMERMLIANIKNGTDTEWLEQRKKARAQRLEETDVIKDFVEYAKEQGSQNAKWYYKCYTTATYKALSLMENKRPALRDTLSIMELSQLTIAEVIAKNSICKYMAEGEHYKTIFTLVKNDLEQFAESSLLV